MHVLIIPSEEFVPPESHLAGIFQLHQARALQAAGHQVGALSIKQSYSIPMLLKGATERLLGRSGSRKLPPGSPLSLLKLLARKRLSPASFITDETVHSIPVTRIEGSYDLKPSERFDHIAWTRAGRTAFGHYVSNHGRPDIIHAHNALYAGILARQLATKHDIPFVITEHSSFLAQRTVHPSLLRQAATVYHDTAQLVTVSPSLGTKLEESVGPTAKGSIWIPNVIDPDLISEPLCDKGLETKDKGLRILAIGSLIPIKDHPTLLHAFAELRKQIPANLVLAGDGSEQNNLVQLAAALDIGDSTKFLGRLSRGEVIEQIDSAACIALTSKFETFGVALIEALARGKPVVATNCGGPGCIVDASNGKLVPVGDHRALATALVDVLSDLSTFNPSDLRSGALKRFGPATIAGQLSDLYQRVSSN